jgi:hypothetical protein
MSKKKKKNKKKNDSAMLQEKMTLFNKLGDKCNACESPFNKKSKEHVTTWKVYVKEQEKIVRLFCPACWDKANNIIKEYNNDFRV